ncbi:hypothetical protein CRG98_035893 [Punica granatum]|uniref:Reverse transcriptase domain-containing protein n=1 Tax=Punica granatum TaxID=22663 RepID=A0A2I0II77_PUNGR|nr:hypothetical protein CRG98_035893 [Punica granatum]
MKKEAIREVLKCDKSMAKACKRPELYIKCSSKGKTCSCPTKKKKRYKKLKMSKAKSRRYSGKRWKYLRKKRRFRKNPRALQQGVKLVQQLETATWISLDKDDVESLFSLDEEAGPSSIAALEVITNFDLTFSESESDTSYMVAEDTKEINLVNSISHISISVYISKYAKLVKVIVFLDNEAAQTIMNPEVLPKECWKPHTKHFRIASSEFFVKLPFKMNENINPTKASHSGMNPEHQKLATAECAELLQQDLIEPSDSPWACESEQKAMCQVFSPIMDQALVYIDDILLFSPSEEAHIKLLQRFSEIIEAYGIMLSEKKMVVGQRRINFLGMWLANGQYQLEPHVAQMLLKYLEESLTKKQAQQFLGTVNYLRDFLLKIAKLTRPLEKMLKKDSLTWGLTQTKAIKKLKAQLQSLLPL